MDPTFSIFQSWETWTYGSLVAITLLSALLSRDGKLETGAYYIVFSWVLANLIAILLTGRTEAWSFIALDGFVMLLFYRLANNYADWAGYVFFVHLFQFTLHFFVIAYPGHFSAYAWLLNAGFIVANAIIIFTAAKRVVLKFGG